MSDKDRVAFLEKAFSNLMFSILCSSNEIKREDIDTILYLFFVEFMESCENCTLVADCLSIGVMMESPSGEGIELMKFISEAVVNHAKKIDFEFRFTGGIATIEAEHNSSEKQC